MFRLEKVSTSLQAFVCLYESLSRAVGVGTAWIKVHIKSTVLSWWPGDFRPIWHTTNSSHHLWHMHLHTRWRWHTCTQYWRWRWLLLSSTKIRVWEGSSTCQMSQYSKRNNTSHIPNQRWTGSWTAGRRSCKYSGKCKGKCLPRRRYSCYQRITQKN